MLKKKSKEIQSIIIYTSGDFPYGMAPENLVRQMTLGLKYHKIEVLVIRIRGKSFNSQNDTGIVCSDLLFNKRVSNELLKFIELFGLLVAIPISLLWNSNKYKPDAIILYGVEYFYFVFPFWLFSKLLNVKIIRFITDYYRTTTIVPNWWKKPKLFFYRFQFKIFDKYLNGIVSLSSYILNLELENKVAKNKICVIPHFIDVLDFCKGLSSDNNKDRIRIGYCGTINKANGIYDLIDAFKLVITKYRDIELLIIGEPLKDEKEKIVHTLATFADYYRITGYLSKREVSKALLSCNILVNPRQGGVFAEAGFPTKLGEYFATKLPVISTNVGDIRYYFTNKIELLTVEPNKPNLIAESIEYLINNRKNAKIIGQNGYLWALANLDYKQNTHKLLKFINSV